RMFSVSRCSDPWTFTKIAKVRSYRCKAWSHFPWDSYNTAKLQRLVAGDGSSGPRTFLAIDTAFSRYRSASEWSPHVSRYMLKFRSNRQEYLLSKLWSLIRFAHIGICGKYFSHLGQFAWLWESSGNSLDRARIIIDEYCSLRNVDFNYTI